MDFFNLIIDRVGDRNVFNLFSGRVPGRETHLQTRVQDDLIDDFLRVVRRVALLSGGVDPDREEKDLAGQLYRTGEIVFHQFFPPAIREILRRSEGGVLFLHLDTVLGHIPWELLHDGTSFLADRFILGRNIGGSWVGENGRQDHERLRMLIVADPTGDLPSAADEGAALYETLNAETSQDLVDIKFISGSRISRLALLEEIQGKDIVHFAGHTGKDSENEFGWLLSGGRLLRGVEIERLEHPPAFVFSNSCSSFGTASLEDSNRLAGAFLRAGVSGYIGTAWDITDSKQTAEFAIEFYRNVFLERSVGEALFEARHQARKRNPARDLTWAAYSLHGNPMHRLFRYPTRRSFDASRSVLNTRRVLEDFPLPVAVSYARFLAVQEQRGIPDLTSFVPLSEAFLWMLTIAGATLLSHYLRLDLKGEQPHFEAGRGFEFYAAQFQKFARRLHVMNLEGQLPGLVQPFVLHRDNIDKMLELLHLLRGPITDEAEALSYIITFQYLLENLFVDFSLFGRLDLFFNLGPEWPGLLFRGRRVSEVRVLPAYSRQEVLESHLKDFSRRMCLFSASRKYLLDVSPFVFWKPESQSLHSAFFDLNFHVDLPE